MKVLAHSIMAGRIFLFGKAVTSCKYVVDSFVTSVFLTYSVGGTVTHMQDISLVIFGE